MAKAMTALQYRNEIIKRMKSIGLYKEEYMTTVKRLATLYVQCDRLEEQFERSGGNAVISHTNKAGATNAMKNPFLTARDEVYTQLLAHERELGLTPTGLKRLNESAVKSETKVSGLAAALLKLDGDDE